MATERKLSDNTAVRGGDRFPRVLIVRIGAMGDVLHAMSAVAALRELHPEWFIGWAIEPGWSELLQTAGDFDRASCGAGRSARMPLVDQWHQVPAKAWKEQPFSLSTLSDINAARRELRMWEYDVCVDMQGSLKSAIVGRMAGARVFAGPAEPRERQARWFYKQPVSMIATHVVEQGCELLGGAVEEILRPAKVSLPVDAEAEAWCDRLLAQTLRRRERFAFVAPTAGWGAKQWPAERYGAVAAELGRAGYRTLVNQVLGDRSADDVIAASEGFATLVPCSIGQMIAVVRRAGVVIAGDTGPLHLAAALERPVVGLYGPTDPARNGPFGTEARVLRHESSTRDHSRRRETEAGLLQITTDEVVEASLALLKVGQDKVNV
ncbi:glycosyltransferase family 9 protein [Tunturiibacter lichenicola]|uniref:glycosyltransferase family 9 protein n=1 Tax=Tunturiibacter lichenicola TaxID=2051959 RepID=UPI003D9AB70D